MSERRFSFRLGTVLRVARLREDMQRQQTRLAALEESEASLRERERTDAYEDLPSAGLVPASTFQAGRAVADLRADALEQARNHHRTAAERLAAARDLLLQDARRTRSLEQLEDRQRAAHALLAAHAAQRALDDLARRRRLR